MPVRAIQVHAKDNVATVVEEVAAGEEVVVDLAGQETTLRAIQAIPIGHKVALREIAEGEVVVKYGEAIGRATQAIPVGAYVHVHNMASQRVWRTHSEPGGELAPGRLV